MSSNCTIEMGEGDYATADRISCTIRSAEPISLEGLMETTSVTFAIK